MEYVVFIIYAYLHSFFIRSLIFFTLLSPIFYFLASKIFNVNNISILDNIFILLFTSILWFYGFYNMLPITENYFVFGLLFYFILISIAYFYLKFRFKNKDKVSMIINFLCMSLFFLLFVISNSSHYPIDYNETLPDPNDSLSTQLDLYKDSFSSKKYSGYYFDISIPDGFKVDTQRSSNYNVTLISKEADVEFFVFSHLWSDDHEFLEQGPNEILLSKEEKKLPRTSDDLLGTYRVYTYYKYRNNITGVYRSVFDQRFQIGFDSGGSGLRVVFGFTYPDIESYEKFKSSYLEFENSYKRYLH